jgi:hypothetical protein
MPSTDRKLELQAKDIDVSTVSQPAVCSNGLMMYCLLRLWGGKKNSSRASF